MYKSISSGVIRLVFSLYLDTGEDRKHDEDRQDRDGERRRRRREEKVIQLQKNFHTSLGEKSLCLGCVFNSIAFSNSYAEALTEYTEAQLSALCHLAG